MLCYFIKVKIGEIPVKAIASFYDTGVMGKNLSRSQAGYSFLSNYPAWTIETCAAYPFCLNLSRSCLKILCQGQFSVSRFNTRTLRTQRQQQYVRENGCARSVLCLLFAVVLWDFSGFLSLTSSLQPEKTQRITANSRHTTLRAKPFSRTYCCWRYVRIVRVSNLDILGQSSKGHQDFCHPWFHGYEPVQ